jgi:predicted MFS family arabinose efflux permease
MAATYAVIVPVLEVPSGVLADRWSRRGVLLLASAAAIVSVVIGGLSNSVPFYLTSAVFLGVFFALQSGTVESIVYDTVLEETGDSELFERTIGRVRVVESLALVGSALAGGLIAQVAPLQATYFLTAPLLALSAAMLFVFREPRLHKADQEATLREQIVQTYRTILSGGHLRLVIVLTVAGSLLMQGMLEFGPLWLVAFLVPPFLYGPHWAGLTAALGLGGVFGAQSWLTRDWAVRLLALTVVACGLVLALSQDALIVVGVQVLLTLVVVAVSIPVTRSLHDAVPSSIRAGVASGVGTLTWLAFVPFALLIGAVSEAAGINQAGWLFVAIGLIAGVIMLVVLPKARPAAAKIAAEEERAVEIQQAPFPADRFLPPDDPDWPGHWANPPAAWSSLDVPVDGPEALAQAQAAIAEMPPQPRQVIVLHDVEGKSSAEIGEALKISSDELRAILDQARNLVRLRLEQFFDGHADER